MIGEPMHTLRFRTPLKRRLSVKARRDQLRAMEKCICGPLEGNVSARSNIEHGPVVPNSGGRCARCLAVKKGRAAS